MYQNFVSVFFFASVSASYPTVVAFRTPPPPPSLQSAARTAYCRTFSAHGKVIVLCGIVNLCVMAVLSVKLIKTPS